MISEAQRALPMQLFDSRTREKRTFEPRQAGRVTMYVCGPTVYGLVHIGNARSAVVFDTLYRVLQARFGQVDYVRNITDVDDKIINTARAADVSTESLTTDFTNAFREDMAALGCLEPVHTPRATEYIDEMILCIKQLIDKGHAYPAERHVLFHVPGWPGYGRLSRRDPASQLAGARVDPAPYKKDPKDFVLWKPSDDDQPGWDSPWGRGRPGWHIECTAMSLALLGFPLDIHGGGSDLLFPHHENERAQSICLHGQDEEFARFWLHNGMLTLGSEKMAKSRGNIKTVRELLTRQSGETLRYALLSAHYAGPLAFSDELLRNSRTTLFRLYETLIENDACEHAHTDALLPDSVWQALLDDLNTPRALASINDLAREINRNASRADHLRQELCASARLMGFMSEAAINEYLDKTRNLDERVLQQLSLRDAARRQKDFAAADRLRDELIASGYEVFDMGAAPSRAIRKL